MTHVGIIDDSALYPLNVVALKPAAYNSGVICFCLKRNLFQNLHVSVCSMGGKRFTDVNLNMQYI